MPQKRRHCSYAKWFPSTSCNILPSGLGCKLDTPTETNSGAFRYDTTHNNNDALVPYPEAVWTAAENSFEQYVAVDPATGPGSHYDKENKADSVYDKTSGLFWTWQSPHAIKETCEALKGIDGLGGQFVFSLGQDRKKDLAHHKAWTTCVASW
jgi:GH18 family chitinase